MHRDEQISLRRVADIDARLEFVEVLVAVGPGRVVRGRAAIAVDVLALDIDRGVSLPGQHHAVPALLQAGGECQRLLEHQRLLFHGRDSIGVNADEPTVGSPVPGIKTDDGGPRERA